MAKSKPYDAYPTLKPGETITLRLSSGTYTFMGQRHEGGFPMISVYKGDSVDSLQLLNPLVEVYSERMETAQRAVSKHLGAT